jgi:diguanylate cyclase (GGDEF)-like protein
MLLITIAFGLFYASMLALRPYGESALLTLSDLTSVSAAFWAASCAVMTSRRLRQNDRSTWAWIAAGCALWAAGEFTWTTYELVLHRETPFPSLADVFYLLAVPALLIGTLRLAAPRRITAQARILTDAFLFTAALAIPIWRDVLLPAFRDGDGSVFTHALAAAYPLADIILLFGLAMALIYPMARQKSVLVFFAAGLAAILAADLGFAVLSASDSYQAGSLTDFLWAAGFLCIACSALSQGAGQSLEESELALPQRWQSAVPIVTLLPLAGWFLYASYTGRMDDDVVTPLLIAGYGILLGLRQVTVHMDLSALSRDVELAHAELRRLYANLEESYQLEMRRARRDGLTGALNRQGILEYVDQLVTAGETFSVCLADMDGLKEVNDSQGHATGDWLLRKVAEVAEARPSTSVGRYGGDEFLIVLPRMDGERCLQEANAIREDFEREAEKGLGWNASSMSIGVATYPEEAETAQELIKLADQRMYEQKRRKETGAAGLAAPGMWPQFFAGSIDGEEDEEAAARDAIQVEELALAIETGALDVHYQPVVNFANRRVVGVEGLVRWRHPTLGLVSAADFVPLAERTALIAPIGARVLLRSCQDMAEWVALAPVGMKEAFVSVNVSGRQVRMQLVDEVRNVLRRTGLGPQHLVLEITESVVMKRHEAARAVLDGIKALGVRLALDDFGRGYSSISYLRYFPFDFVKLDSAFVRGILTHGKEEAMAPSILSLAHSIGLSVIVEGIETEADLESLRSLPIDFAQGYLYGKPAAAEDVSRVIVQHAGSPPSKPGLAA